MATALEDKKDQPNYFDSVDFTAEHVAVAFLMQRIAALPKESLADLTSLAPEMANCSSRSEFLEIAETIREILFPRDLLGNVSSNADAIVDSPQLTKHNEFVGAKIREARKSRGLSQQQLAQNSGLPQSHISRLESGQHSPTHLTLQRIAKALEVDSRDLDPIED